MPRQQFLHLGLAALASLALGPSGCGEEPPGFDETPSEFRGLQDDLQLHWSFEDRVDGQITDLSGNDRHGSLVGGSFVSSPLGEAVSLDGVDDYLGLTNLGLRSPTLYGGVDGDFTVSARVRVADADKYNTLCFGCGPFSTFYVGTPSYGPKLLAALSNQQGGTLWPLSSATLANEEWHEVTVVVDGGTNARFYVDCAAGGQLDNANVGLADSQSSSVGRGSDASRWFGGEIDRLQVWSRALSEQEMAGLCPQMPLLKGLELHWSFEDRVDIQIIDVSGNGHHGTLVGGAFIGSATEEAVSLDGVDDYIAFAGPRSPALYGGVDGEFTISARVRVADLGRFNTLCYGCGPSSIWYLGDPVYGTRMSAAFYNQSNGGSLWTASTPTLAPDTWTEVTTVVDAGASVRHYIDCGLDSEALNANIGLADYGYSAVGQGTNASRWFGGEIDELRIWNRALPEAEVEQLCSLCSGPIRVDVDAPDGGDGSSWATAFNDLQTALDAAHSCAHPEVWVAEGVYLNAALDGFEPIVRITAPAEIYGGFAGTETSRDQRDFTLHPTQLGQDWFWRVVVIADTAIEAGRPLRLDGFTITNATNGAIEVEDLTIDTTEPLLLLHNLVLSDNTAVDGGGLNTRGKFGVDIVSSRFEANAGRFPYSEAGAIYSDGSFIRIDASEFIDNQSKGPVIYQDWTSQTWGDWGTLEISNSVVSGSIGGGIRARHLVAINTEFTNNSVENIGGAINVPTGSLELHDCSFSGNSAVMAGGAIHLDNALGPGTYTITNSSFSGNSARRGGAIHFERYEAESAMNLEIHGGSFTNNWTTNFSGGAIHAWAFDELAIDGVSFVGNTSYGNGGAIYANTGEFVTIANSSFIDNSADKGGAISIEALTSFTLRDSRLVSNDAAILGGGMLATNDPTSNSVINTEIIANTSGSHGAGIYGRATFVSTTFANNLAGGEGDGLFAEGGPEMTLRGVTSWPDNIWAGSMVLDHSCVPAVPQAHTNDGTVFIDADPFAPDDLDLDGLSEYYLAPGSACVDLGGVVDEFDWTTLTTQASQCTDFTPLDAGVHYLPQSAVGPC